MLRVAQLNVFDDPGRRSPDELLRAWPTLIDVAQAVASAGAKVTLLQAHAECHHRSLDGVDLHFLPFGPRTGSAAGWRALASLLDAAAPDVLHVHGLGFPRALVRLSGLQSGRPIVVQDHADRPPRWWRRGSWRRGLAAAHGLAFCTHEQAQPFLRTGLIGPQHRVIEVPEASSRFVPGDAAAAREATGASGRPALLWVGHLNANKDPLTVLEAVARAAQALPGLRLWCCFGSAPLLDEVQRRIASDARLQGRVHLLGTVPHDRVQRLMQAADFLVLGSHVEGCCYAVIEALASGLPPIVTDLPSMRRLTGGSVGAHVACGDVQGMSQAIVRLASMPQAPLRAAARAQFERELSPPALGRRWLEAYAAVIDTARHGAPR
jgi:glycosyltransferase involved in cell wall biosynthesis